MFFCSAAGPNNCVFWAFLWTYMHKKNAPYITAWFCLLTHHMYSPWSVMAVQRDLRASRKEIERKTFIYSKTTQQSKVIKELLLNLQTCGCQCIR